MMRAAVLFSWFAAMPCGGGGSPPPDTSPDTPPRTYRLASSGVQLDPAMGPVMTDPDLASDVDVVNVHQDFFGVPWDAFSAGTAPPPAWAAKLADIAHDAHATGKDIFPALAPLDGPSVGRHPDAAHPVRLSRRSVLRLGDPARDTAPITRWSPANRSRSPTRGSARSG